MKLSKKASTGTFIDKLRYKIEKRYYKRLLDTAKARYIEGDIRNLEQCKNAVTGVDYVLHQAALGSVPRSINDPITSNEVNVSGFLNMSG